VAKDWKDADATVTSVSEAGSNRGRTVYLVGFSYKVGEQFYGGTFTTGDEYAEGDSVGVKYDAKDPERNDLVEKERRSWWILWAVGGLVVALWLLVMVIGRRR